MLINKCIGSDNKFSSLYYNYYIHNTDDGPDVTLDRLLLLLRKQVSSMWREFGEVVDIDDVVLDSIAKTTFPENCVVEVFDYWLKYSNEKLTWKDVADALNDMDLYELAKDIEQMYERGESHPGEQIKTVNILTPIYSACDFSYDNIIIIIVLVNVHQ